MSYSWLREGVESAPITRGDLDQLENYADRLFAKVGIDVEFTRHFLDRVNDERNKRQITMAELTRLFKQEYKKYGKKIAQLGPDAEAVMKDMKTDVNMPFLLRWDSKNQELDLVAKTVMRKKDFRTPDPEFAVEAYEINGSLVDKFLKATGGKYGKRDQCGPACLDFIDWARKQGIELKRVRGEFVADEVVSAKADFTPEMKKEFAQSGLDWNSAADRKAWIEQSKYAEEWKRVPHYWTVDKDGNIHDPSGYQQLVKTGLAKDLDPSRYIPEGVNETSPFALAKRFIDPVIKHGSYEKASKTLYDILSRKKKEDGKLKHGIAYYAQQIAKSFAGVDYRALEKYFRDHYDIAQFESKFTSMELAIMEGGHALEDAVGHKDLLTMPNNTLVIDTPGELDWYKLGQHFPTLDKADPREFGQSESDVVITFASDAEKQKFIKLAAKLGLVIKDIGGTATHPEIHNEDKEADYMHGDCHVMAIAMVELNPGWKIMGRIGFHYEDEAEEVDHIFAVAPDGTAYDCRGKFNSVDDLLADYDFGADEVEIQELTMSDIKGFVADGELKAFTDADVERAKKYHTQVDEVLKRVKGKWALVSKNDPKKVLQYYRGPKDQKPSDEWVKKVERRVHAHEYGESVNEVDLDEGPISKALGTAALAGALALGTNWSDKLSSAGDVAKTDQAQVTQTVKQDPQAIPKVIPKPKPTNYKPITNNKNELVLLNTAQKAGLKGVELVAFMAQMAHESENFTDMIEDISHERAAKKYGKGKIAKTLGNKNKTDAQRFKGRGYIQLTGRWNYEWMQKELGIDLTSTWSAAQQAAKPDIAAKIAVAYWKKRVKPNVDDFEDVRDVTKQINPGLHGLKHREKRFDTMMLAMNEEVIDEFKIEKPDAKDTMGIKRNQMPQIATEDYPEFIDYLKDNGAHFSKATVDPKSLKAIQGEFSDSGVLKALKKRKLDKPIIASTDNYIIDGHHRWIAALNTGVDVNIYRVDKPGKELLQLVKDFPKTTYKDIYEGVGIITAQNTTKDVKPGETQRQAAKFGMKVDKNNNPPLLHKKAAKNSTRNKLFNIGIT